MLASTQTKRLDIPHEPGEYIEIRMLSARKREEAHDAKMQSIIRALSGGADLFKSAMESGPDEPKAEKDPSEKDPLTSFDKWMILRAGIVSWSYNAKVRPDTIDDLDEETADWAAREILAFGAQTEEHRKN